MSLTPLDAEKERFRIGFRGYARDDVEWFRAQMIAALEDHITVESQLRSRINDLESRIARYHETEDLVKDSVILAQRTCDELVAAAHQQADAIKQEARLEGSQIRGELSDLRSQREQFEYAFHGLLTGFKHRLEQGNPALSAATAPTPVELPGSRQIAPVAEEIIQSEPEPPRLSPARVAADLVSPAVEPPLPPAPSTTEPIANMGGAAQPPGRQLFAGIPPVKPVAVPHVPSVLPAHKPVPSPRPGGGGEIDRDADIADFSAALDGAGPDPQPVWPESAPK